MRIRPPRLDEADAVVALLNADAIALGRPAVASRDWVASRWTAPGADRDRDCAVIERVNGELVAYLAVASLPPHTEVFTVGSVAPAFHGRGLGQLILAECEHRARGLVALAAPGARVVQHSGTLADEPRVAALHRSSGFVDVRSFWQMRIDFEVAPTPPTVPPGIELRSLRVGVDEPAVYAADREAFEDHWGDAFTDEATWRHRTIEAADGFDSSLWFLAWAGDELAGYLIGEAAATDKPDHGSVELLGVRRAYRRRGVAEALLRSSFAALHERGRAGVTLLVDAESPTGATRLYERWNRPEWIDFQELGRSVFARI